MVFGDSLVDDIPHSLGSCLWSQGSGLDIAPPECLDELRTDGIGSQGAEGGPNRFRVDVRTEFVQTWKIRYRGSDQPDPVRQGGGGFQFVFQLGYRTEARRPVYETRSAEPAAVRASSRHSSFVV